MAHELFGVTPEIRSVVDEIAAAGHLVTAPEFYHRDAEAGRFLSRDDAGRTEGFALLHDMTGAGAVADVRAAVSALTDRYAVREAAVVGFSAGGYLAYLAAATLELTRGISGELLFVVGEKDFLIDSDQVEKISSALRTAGVRHEVVVYPEVQHAFFWPDTPAFDQAARDDAMKRVLALLSR
ncbi:dienelactone hydrolase family protein [Parafrankia soli]|uniref:dienelactone hydrolase family protein n=1 Tax=Parafrankia soli TaxID=2599596 RepID=UPI001F52833C|nr:dienelactone hydrolase family protein [Parafrankia soli]